MIQPRNDQKTEARNEGDKFMERTARDLAVVKVGDILEAPTMTAKITEIEWIPTHNALNIHIDNGQTIGLGQLQQMIKNGQIKVKGGAK